MERLCCLPRGVKARVAGVTGTDSISLRLRELGLIEGRIVELLGRSPFGGPQIYRVGAVRLALRRNEADRVDVERITETVA